MYYKNISIFIITLIFTISNIAAQCGPGDTVVISTTAPNYQSSPVMSGNLNNYYKKGSSTRDRVIFFIPGLGGDHNAWQDVYDETAGANPQYPLYPERDAEVKMFAKKDYPGYTEDSDLASAGADLFSKMSDVEYSNIGITDPTNNIVISHSQGGLVSRAAEHHITTTNRPRFFGGAVTFGSPHQGAEILTNGLPVSKGGRGKLGDFGNGICTHLTEGPLYDQFANLGTISTILIQFFNIDTKLSDLKANLCSFMTSDPILELAFPNLTPAITQDYMASNEYHNASNFLLNTLNNYTPSIPMVAFYGVEEEPVVWRQLGSLAEGVHTYPPFQADPDQQYVNAITDLMVAYYGRYLAHQNQADWHKQKRDLYCAASFIPGFRRYGVPVYQCVKHVAEYNHHLDARDGYLEGASFLYHANDKWKAIIGARKTQVQQNGFHCVCYNITLGNFTTSIVPTKNDCDQGWVYGESDLSFCKAYPKIETNVIYKESDGVVLAESAKNLPGAVVNPALTDDDYKLKDTNHQQLRNSSKTAEKLNDLFDTDIYGKFFITSER